ncbi:hypothetical protein RND71_003125 [Anisodus tanguticus]|uniref:Rad51-like C-terminal domain-containing protein n=1 Tax=Anisodus tanguticus TaxID=243964 RepID=A0AAE1SU11_9SOLA|nr:hypothetical protein RND71_003125 [Anisodus tanguticus]
MLIDQSGQVDVRVGRGGVTPYEEELGTKPSYVNTIGTAAPPPPPDNRYSCPLEYPELAETSKNNDIDENVNIEHMEENEQLEEIVAEIQAAKTKGEKHRKKRKQRRRRNALKVARNRVKETSKQGENSYRRSAPTVEGENQNKDKENEENFQTEITSPAKEKHVQKTMVVITAHGNEEGNTQDISVPSNPQVKIYNTYQSIADDTGQLEEHEEDQVQDTENTILEETIPGKDQEKIMSKGQTDTNIIRVSHEKLVTVSSNGMREDNTEGQSKEYNAGDQVQENYGDEVANSLINVFSPEPAEILEVNTQFKEAIEKGHLSPRGSEVSKSKNNKKPSTSTLAVLIRGKGTEVDKICEAAEKILLFGYIIGLDALLIKKAIVCITTGSQAWDELLGGGIETSAITKAFGQFNLFRFGKTQLAHTLYVSTQAEAGDGVFLKPLLIHWENIKMTKNVKYAYKLQIIHFPL